MYARSLPEMVQELGEEFPDMCLNPSDESLPIKLTTLLADDEYRCRSDEITARPPDFDVAEPLFCDLDQVPLPTYAVENTRDESGRFQNTFSTI